MTSSPLPIGFPAQRQRIAKVKLKKAEDFASIAQLVEAFIPKFKREEGRQFYSEVARLKFSYTPQRRTRRVPGNP